MRKLLTYFLILSLFSCDKESFKEVPLTASKIVGSWQIISNTYSIGGPLITDEVSDGGIYTFNIDNTFNYSAASESDTDFAGTYLLEEDLLTLSYNRDGEDIEWLLIPSFNGREMRLSPGGDILCIEGCYFTVRKLRD